jgi:signal peptidase II
VSLARLAYLLAGVVIALDQLTKALILYAVRLPEVGKVELSSIFDLTMVWNRGVSFGLFRADQDLTRWLLVLFSLGVSAALALWARKADRLLLAWAIGLVMGGAIGNVIDRIRFGAVVDFLDFSGLWFPWVFNIADSAITVGVVLLLVDSFLSERKGAIDSPQRSE